MNDHDAMIASINACPFDDAPRLIYADFIEERGELERASFIRRQIQNASKPAIDQRIAHIYVRYAPRGFDDLLDIQPWRKRHKSSVILFKGEGWGRCIGWHRGFPFVIGCSAQLWKEHKNRFPVQLLFVGLDEVRQWPPRKLNPSDVYRTTFVRYIQRETITGILDLYEFKRREAAFIAGQLH